MALNIHTDLKFEKTLEWLARHTGTTKTDVIKNLVLERFHLKKMGFRFGAMKRTQKKSSRTIQKALKELDADHDLD